ncbi:transmembrane protein 42-like [Hyalella azteca]|uniref:Transmembrane protein 42-like n=1 Tax=Hyalella azteca TaxID=294128 RepID=A0A8B7N6J8_HYAAZ|nr:transmembrane protein 42-like [Hyalella azteca]
MKGQVYAIISGVYAALGAMFGKLAMTSHEAIDLCTDILVLSAVADPHVPCNNWGLWLRIAAFLLMVTMNTLMFVVLTKAFRFCSTSIEATITSAAANFLFTGILGKGLFGEEVTGVWWLGLVFILCGLMLLHHTNAAKEEARKPGTLPKKKEKLW